MPLRELNGSRAAPNPFTLEYPHDQDPHPGHRSASAPVSRKARPARLGPRGADGAGPQPMRRLHRLPGAIPGHTSTTLRRTDDFHISRIIVNRDEPDVRIWCRAAHSTASSHAAAGPPGAVDFHRPGPAATGHRIWVVGYAGDRKAEPIPPRVPPGLAPQRHPATEGLETGHRCLFTATRAPCSGIVPASLHLLRR